MIVKRATEAVMTDDVFLSYALDQVTLAAELPVKVLYIRSDQVRLFESTNDDLH